MNTLGERIKDLRKQANLTQQQVAERIGKSKGNVSGYEKGSYEPSAGTIIGLAKCFNISTDYILFGEEHKTQFVNKKEEELVHHFQNCDRDSQELVLNMCKKLSGSVDPAQEELNEGKSQDYKIG